MFDMVSTGEFASDIDFDVHSFGAGAAGVAAVGAFAMMTGVHAAASETQEIVAERKDVERFAYLSQAFEDLLQTNRET